MSQAKHPWASAQPEAAPCCPSSSSQHMRSIQACSRHMTSCFCCCCCCSTGVSRGDKGKGQLGALFSPLGAGVAWPNSQRLSSKPWGCPHSWRVRRRQGPVWQTSHMCIFVKATLVVGATLAGGGSAQGVSSFINEANLEKKSWSSCVRTHFHQGGLELKSARQTGP